MIRRIVHNNYLFVVSLFFLYWFIASDNFAKMVGTILPVVEPLTVDSAIAYGHTSLASTRITGHTVKNYDCNFVSMAWTVEEHGVKGSAASYFLDAPKGRLSGEIAFTGIIVGITPDRLSVAHSTVTHRCGGLKVITEWYGG